MIRFTHLSGSLQGTSTMDHVATAVQEVSEVTKRQTKKRWVRVVGIVAGAALVVIAGLGTVIYVQHRQIAKLLDAKERAARYMANLLAEFGEDA